MSQMYAIFEEIVGPQPNPVHGDIHGETTSDEIAEESCQPGEVMTSNISPTEKSAQNPHEDTEESSKPSSLHGSCAGSPGVARNRMNNGKHYHRHHYGSRLHSSTLPHPRKQKEATKFVCKSSSNPLLDTISVLAYDPCDSDDYYDLSSVYEQRRILSSTEDKNRGSDSVGTHPVEGDRESIGYAGSNSIDSGYKSFCPTPEIPDPSIYAAEVSRGQTSSTNAYSFYTDSSNSSRSLECGKPKTMMGTKAISRQGQVTGSRDVGSRISDSSLYEVNLDHLMYLRQSLLSAIQKCESSKSRDDESAYGDSIETSSTKASRKDCHLPNYKSRNTEQCVNTNTASAERQLTDNCASSCTTSSSTTASSTSSVPTYQKTVRFNTDVKVSTLSSSTKTNCESVDGVVNSTNQSSTVSSGTSSRRKDKDLYPGSRFQSKSILKDPLCANLRSQLEAGAPDCTLEEEIDSLLYGRAEFYDLESVDDFPCSYVTMIEEKYRSGKPSLAKVRKLKGGKTQDTTKAIVGTESSKVGQSTEDTEAEPQHHSNGKESSSITKSLTSVAKSRFTEVARCMLEIIEDLQLKKLQLDTGKSTKETSNSQTSSNKTTPLTSDIKDNDTKKGGSSNFNVQPADDVSVTSPSKCNDSSTAGYASAVEYHVYEEIAYDFIGNTNSGERQTCLNLRSDVPPPLPARPTSMLQKMEQQQPLRPNCASSNLTSISGLPPAPQPPSRRGRCSRRSVEEGSVRNRPKQRSNLYSLFADQAERRNISRSLEREWRVAGKDEHADPEDEYGFRKVFPSI